jgi:hypothetical protein
MAVPRRFRAWQLRLHDPALTVLLIVQLIAMFVLTPLAAMGVPLPPLMVELLLSTVIGIVMLITVSRWAIALAVLSVALIIYAEFLRISRPSVLSDWIGHVGTILGFSTLSWVVARAVFAGGRVNVHRVQGAIVLYLNFAMIFTSAYRLVFELSPGAFKGIPPDPAAAPLTEHGVLATMLYFSFTTLTSVGFGDVVPVHPIARSLANMEAIVGQLYPATLLARVVTLDMENRRRRRDRQP